MWDGKSSDGEVSCTNFKMSIKLNAVNKYKTEIKG